MNSSEKNRLKESCSIGDSYNHSKRRNLIQDAKFELSLNLTSQVDLNVKKKEQIVINKFMITLNDYSNDLKKLMEIIKDNNAYICHIDDSLNDINKRNTIYIKIKCNEYKYLKIIKILQDLPGTFSNLTQLGRVNDLKHKIETIWIPHSICDLNICNNLSINYEPCINSKHPGFSDLEYRKRRQHIADIAYKFKHGDMIPKVEYTNDEISTWNSIYIQLASMYPLYACKEHIEAFKQLEEAKIFNPNCIPQLEDVSKYLKQKSGFQLRPCAGLLTARDFLASLAFRCFQCTQYIRHSSVPFYSPEPDCVHELLGHIPLLSNLSFADFSQQIGLASLGVSDEDIVKLSTLYWFTVEFGICKENGEMKAYGAGLLSAYGELEYALSNKPQLKPFNPETTALEPYQDEEYQSVYFVTESFDQVKEQLRIYSNKIKRPHQIKYDSNTQSIKLDENDIHLNFINQ